MWIAILTELVSDRMRMVWIEHEPLGDAVDTGWDMTITGDCRYSTIPILIHHATACVGVFLRGAGVNDGVGGQFVVLPLLEDLLRMVAHELPRLVVLIHDEDVAPLVGGCPKNGSRVTSAM